MPLKTYGVLKGRPVGRRLAVTSNAHYQIHIVDDETDYRIAVNVRSNLSPSEVEYLVEENFNHPITTELLDLPLGFKSLVSKPGGLALDFIRVNLFNRDQMKPLPFDVVGPDNDLNEKLDKHVQRALADEEALIYAFGERWGPEPNQKDKIFGFSPGNGIHDIHMNQGNSGKFQADDGVYQDGAMLIHYPSQDQWVGIFLKFQSQTWHTDDKTGHRIEAGEMPSPHRPEQGDEEEPVSSSSGDPDGLIRIIAALVNPMGPSPEKETVTLINTSSQQVDLTNWSIADRLKNKHPLSGKLDPGATLVVTLTQEDFQLGNKGGVITLLNDQGLKIDGVSYTQRQAQREGWTIVF